MAVKEYDGVTYDDSVDYSSEIEKARAEGRDTSSLEASRKAKINDPTGKYKGTEPTMNNSNKTYSQLSQDRDNGSSSAQRDIDESVISQPGGTLYYKDGTPAVSNSGKGYNTNLETWLKNPDGLVSNMVKDKVLTTDGKTPYGTDAAWDTVNEYINQKTRWAQANGQTYNPQDDYNLAVSILGQPGGGSGGGSSNKTQTSKKPSTGGSGSGGSGGGSGYGSSSGGGGTPYSASNNMYDYLEQWFKSAQQQQTNAIDWATSQAIQEAQLAQDEANAQFQTQRNQVAIDEARAKDNQALYAERRGDNGGIGAAQYDSIMNTAAQNRLSVNQAQTKMAGDTARTISNLRAQGEYEKADALLELSQTYLAQLISLEQWSMQFGLSVAQFNAQLEQWDKEYQMKVADITGTFNGQPTFAAQRYQNETLAEQGWALLGMGVPPSESQMAAMGITPDQANQYITNQRIQKSLKTAPKTEEEPVEMDLDAAYRAAYESGDGYEWLRQKKNYQAYGLSTPPTKESYDEWVSKYTADAEDVSWIAKQWVAGLTRDYASDEDRLLELYRSWTGNNNATLDDLERADGNWGPSKGWMTEEDLDYLLMNLGLL